MKRLPLWVVFILATTLVPYSAWASGTVRYVDSTAGSCTGNYSIASRNCTGSDGNSYATITLGIAAMAAGDITYVRAGTYTDYNINLPAGVSASVPSVLQAYQDEVVTIVGASGAGRKIIYNTGRAYQKYWNLDIDGALVGSDAVKVDVGSHGFVIGGDMTSGGAFRCKVRNGQNMGISAQGVSNSGTISGCDIYDNGLVVLAAPYTHGIYIQKGDGWIIEKNRIRRNGCNGMQLYTNPTNAIVRRNQIYDNARIPGCGTQLYVSNAGHVIEYNQVWNDLEAGNTYGIRVQLTSPTGVTVRHNTVYNGGTNGIYIAADATSTIVQNNLVIGSTNGVVDLGTGTTLTDNLTSGTASVIFKSIVSGAIDLAIKAGSPALDGGTDIGLAYNTTPDQGAHEAPKFSSCEAKVGEPDRVYFRFTNNLRPPMRPASGLTGITFRLNAAANAPTSFVQVSDNEYYAVVTTSQGGGDVIDMSINPSTTNLTDSALIGSTNNQPFISTITDRICTNNLGGAPSHTYTQARYELHGWRGSEDAPDILPHGFPSTGSAENFPNYKVYPGAKLRVRFAAVCGVVDCPKTTFHPYFSTGGAYATITDNFSVNAIKMCGIPSGTDMPANASPTTCQLSTGGNCVPGGIVFTANDVPEISGLNVGYKTEMEYCVETAAGASGYFDLRLYLDSGAALNVYTVTPRLVVVPVSAGGM